jgi:DNA polymerase
MFTVPTERCPDCKGDFMPLPGDGPQPAEILLLAERPGANENQQGRILIGKAGQELDQTYLPLAGLDRRDVRCANVVRCWAENNRTPSDKEIASCADCFIPAELAQTRPEVVVLMGGSACSLVPGIRLDYQHGRPFRGEILGYSCWLLPMFHPASGLHQGRFMTSLLEDWAGFGKWLRTGRPITRTADAHLVFKLVEKVEDLPDDFGTSPGVDTERHGPAPFSVQLAPSVTARRADAVMLLADNRDALAETDRRLRLRAANSTASCCISENRLQRRRTVQPAQ